MFVELPKYVSRSDKDSRYCQSLYIDDEQDLKIIINELLAHNDEYTYRGVYDASYKMYSSSQRLWFEDDVSMLRFNCKNYYDTIENFIKLVRSQSNVEQYLKQKEKTDNDFLILAMLQELGLPSPILDFSNDLLKGLFYAVDKMPIWTDCGTKNLEDYVSLYYISRNIDWEQKEKCFFDLQYNQILKSDNIFFLPIDDSSFMSFFNNTKDIPLIEVVNTVRKTKYFHCLNIRKNLVPIIRLYYLQPHGLTDDSVYHTDDMIYNQLKAVFNQI